jgi:hypothetical protein
LELRKAVTEAKAGRSHSILMLVRSFVTVIHGHHDGDERQGLESVISHIAITPPLRPDPGTNAESVAHLPLRVGMTPPAAPRS